MKIKILKHVEFENPGYFLDIFSTMGAEIEMVNLFENKGIHKSEYNLLLVMGGPMNIYEEDKYPWLKEEKNLVKDAIDQGKIVVGVCLGAQLIADAMGEKVYPLKSREIGWFPVYKSNPDILSFLPDIATVFHWHGETFNAPPEAQVFYSSDATPNQSFIYDSRVLALQFHLEMTEQGICDIVENCRDELDNSKFVMKDHQITGNYSGYAPSNRRMLRHLIKWLLEKNSLD